MNKKNSEKNIKSNNNNIGNYFGNKDNKINNNKSEDTQNTIKSYNLSEKPKNIDLIAVNLKNKNLSGNNINQKNVNGLNLIKINHEKNLLIKDKKLSFIRDDNKTNKIFEDINLSDNKISPDILKNNVEKNSLIINKGMNHQNYNQRNLFNENNKKNLQNNPDKIFGNDENLDINRTVMQINKNEIIKDENKNKIVNFFSDYVFNEENNNTNKEKNLDYMKNKFKNGKISDENEKFYDINSITQNEDKKIETFKSEIEKNNISIRKNKEIIDLTPKDINDLDSDIFSEKCNNNFYFFK